MSTIDDNPHVNDYLGSVYIISHSTSSVKAYKLGIKHFSEFLLSKYGTTIEQTIDSLLQEKIDQYRLLQEFVVHLDNKGQRPNSIKLSLTGVRGFLRHCGVKIYSEDFRSKVKLPKSVHVREEPLTKEIILRVLNNVSPKIRAIILVAIASGMRIGEIIQLRISDVDFESNPTRIRIRAETTKNRESRETFLTAESTKALKDYLFRVLGWNEKHNSETHDYRIFGPSRESKSDLKIVECNLAHQLNKQICDIPGLSKRSENGVHMIHFHAFRKFFRTTVGNAVGRDYAEALIGHHFYLDTYYNLPEEEKRELYLKAEPNLTVFNFASVEKDLISIKKKQQEIEQNQLDIISMIKDENIDFPRILEKYIRSKNRDDV